MPLHNFTRPDYPYENNPLRNDSHFKVITETEKRPVDVKEFEYELNSHQDQIRTLNQDMENLSAGVIPGSDDPNNNNKFFTTDGEGNQFFSKVTSSFINDNSIPGGKVADLSINTEKLADGLLLGDKVPDESIPWAKISVEDEDIDFQKVGFEEDQLDGKYLKENTVDPLKLKPVTTDKIADSAVTLIKLADEVKNFMNAMVPIGSTLIWNGNGDPTSIPGVIEWKEENGQFLNRVTYAALFAIYGTTHGAGDGVTTFALPDSRGRTSVGIGSDNSTGDRITNATAAQISLGKSFGFERHTLTIPEMPAHNHNARSFTGGPTPANGWASINNNGTMTPTELTGGGQPHNNTQPSIFRKFYVRAL